MGVSILSLKNRGRYLADQRASAPAKCGSTGSVRKRVSESAWSPAASASLSCTRGEAGSCRKAGAKIHVRWNRGTHQRGQVQRCVARVLRWPFQARWCRARRRRSLCRQADKRRSLVSALSV